MRRAADAPRAPFGAAARAVAERAAGLKGRRDKFVASLNGALARAGSRCAFRAAGPVGCARALGANKLRALVIGETGPARARLQQLGGYGASCADPARLRLELRRAANLRNPGACSAETAPARGAPSLLARYLDGP